MVREQVPLVPVPSHHMAACAVRGLDLVIQVSLVLHIRDEWYLGMEDVQEQSHLLHDCRMLSLTEKPMSPDKPLISKHK